MNTSTYTIEDLDYGTLASPQRTVSSFSEEPANGVQSDAFGLVTPYETVQTYRTSAQHLGSASDFVTDTGSYDTGSYDTRDGSAYQQDIGQSLFSGTDFGFSLAGAYRPEEYDLEMTMNTPSTSLIPSPYGNNPSSESPAQASTAIRPNNEGNDCTCIGCNYKKFHGIILRPENSQCIIPSCEYSCKWASDFRKHLKNHFVQSGHFSCNAPGCKNIFARWSDILRHYGSSHCRRPQKFPCDFLACERGGDNGFPRKDKLTDHKKVHEGKEVHRKQPRVIKPKVQG